AGSHHRYLRSVPNLKRSKTWGPSYGSALGGSTTAPIRERSALRRVSAHQPRERAFAMGGWRATGRCPAYSGSVTPDRILTLGHGTLATEDFLDLVRGAGATRIVDVRSFPGSRRNPQFGREAMAGWLTEAGLDYV